MAGKRHIALLRGINVGGRNKLRMADLDGVFEEVGCTAVESYIQSGNVVFEAPAQVAASVPGRVEALLAARYGVRSPVVTRTADELAGVVGGVPFAGKRADPACLHVAFLGVRPTAKAAAALDPVRSPGDVFQVVGREVYLHLPHGVAATKLTNAYLDKTLGTVSTLRNWRTVLKLAEMCGR